MPVTRPGIAIEMTRCNNALAALLVTTLLVGCDGASAPDMDTYRAEIDEWREMRLERLKSPTGFLNLAGLFWITSDTMTIGSDPGNDIVLPASAAPRVGVVRLTDTGVLLETEPGVDVRYEDIPVRSILMAADVTGEPVTIHHASLAWMIIQRDERYALRLRDFEHPALTTFPPLEYYPVNLDYRVEATLEAFDEPRVLNVDTVIEGLGWNPQSPGKLHFELNGATYALEAYDAGGDLFLVFGDQTSGRETYPAGRFLYALKPGSDGKTILDFNYSYNPPCAFNDFATCPVASPQNRLATRIEAGELFDPEEHFTPDSVH